MVKTKRKKGYKEGEETAWGRSGVGKGKKNETGSSEKKKRQKTRGGKLKMSVRVWSLGLGRREIYTPENRPGEKQNDPEKNIVGEKRKRGRETGGKKRNLPGGSIERLSQGEPRRGRKRGYKKKKRTSSSRTGVKEKEKKYWTS